MLFFKMNNKIVHLAVLFVAAHAFSNASRSMNIGFMAITVALFCKYSLAKATTIRHIVIVKVSTIFLNMKLTFDLKLSDLLKGSIVTIFGRIKSENQANSGLRIEPLHTGQQEM